jgi:biopolymer transport protein ExbB
MLANIIVDYFFDGGPIMYPILVVALVGVAVIAERVFWWARERLRRDPLTLEKIFVALEEGDLEQAKDLARDTKDPIIRMIWHGLNHHNTSLEGALQMAAGRELQRAGRFLTVLDTLVTLAPLLGLLGTVTGIMDSFNEVKSSLSVDKVTGGIGEALIATTCGLGIAIVALIPFNFFTNRAAKLQFDLESAATNVEVFVKQAKLRGLQEQADSQEKLPILNRS